MASRTTKKLLSSNKLILDGKSLRFFSTQRTSGILVAETTGSLVTTNLVVHLDASDSSSYGGGGTTWNDLTGGNNVTLVNGPPHSQGPFPSGSGYVTFDGTDDYFTTTYSTSQFRWWDTDYTIEAWIYPTTLTDWYDSTIPALVGNMDPSGVTDYWSFGPYNSSGNVKFYYWNGSSQNAMVSTESVIANSWNHIAFIKNSSGCKIFVNGVGTDYMSISGTPQDSTSYNLTVGAYNNADINGYVSDLRIVRGTALYTSNFTPAGNPLTAVTNTKLLTCQGNSITDASDSSHNISVTGNAASVYDDVPYFDFDGSNDYAQSGTSNDLIIGTQDYTMSLWLKYDSAKSEICLMDNRTASGNGTTFSLVQVGDAMRVKVWEDNTSSYSFESSTNLSANTWYNITYTRISNSASMYINGVQDGSSWAQTYNYSGGNKLTLGWNYSTQTGKSMDGHIPHVLFYVNKGLTSSEVTQNYNAIKSRYQEIITTNLVFHLDAANGGSYGGSGTTWFDLSTNSNNATLTGPTFNSNNGGYFDFDGSNDHAITSSDMFNPNSNFTFSAWVNSDSTITGTMVSDYSYQGSLQIRFVNDGTVQIVDSYVVNVGTFTNFTYSTGTWYNVVVTRSSNTYSLYINGVFKSSFTSSNVYSYGPQSIGTNYSGVERWNGKISQIACYDTALSATQVEQNFDVIKSRYGYEDEDNSTIVTTNLLMHVDAGDSNSYGGSGTTWSDLSGNGNNITLSSSGISYNSTDGGGSIVFDGTNGQGTSSINLTNMNSGGSLEIWCKITDTSGYRHIGGWRASASAFYMLLLLGDGRMEARAKWASSSNTDIVTSDYGTSFWANNWNHIVFTNSDSDSKTRFYLNGSLVSTSSGTVGTLPSNTLFELMKTANLSTATAAGRLSQVRVYSDTLSASEVTQNYNATKSRFGL